MKKILKITCLVLTVIIAIMVLMAGWGGHIAPSTWSLPALFTLAFVPIAAMGLVWLIVLAVLRRWILAAAMAVVMLAVWPTVRINSPLNVFSPKVDDYAQTLKVMTWNVMGFDDIHNRKQLSASMLYILEKDPDVVIMQETTLGPLDFIETPGVIELRERIEERYPYHTRGYHDLGIMSKVPYRVYEDSTMTQGFGSIDNGRTEYHFYAKAFDIDLGDGRQLRLLGLHLQSIGLSSSDRDLYVKLTKPGEVGQMNRAEMSQAKNSLYGKVASAFRRREVEANMVRNIIDNCPPNLIVCGDFNDVPGSYSYRTIKGDDLSDAYADCAFGPTFTFNQNRLYFKIDQFMYRGDMTAVEAKCPHVGGSDHYPIVVTLKWNKSTQ